MPILKNPDKKLIFIDESGNPGSNDYSSKYFIMSAVIIGEDVYRQLKIRMGAMRKELGLIPDYEFKFSRTKKSYTKELLEKISNCDYQVVTMVYRKNNDIKFKNNKSVYNNLLLEVLENTGLNEASVNIDGKVGKKYRRNTEVFLRKNIKNLKFTKFQYLDSAKSDGIQLADLISGSIARTYTKKVDSREYYRLVRAHIIRELKA